MAWCDSSKKKNPVGRSLPHAACCFIAFVAPAGGHKSRPVITKKIGKKKKRKKGACSATSAFFLPLAWGTECTLALFLLFARFALSAFCLAVTCTYLARGGGGGTEAIPAPFSCLCSPPKRG